MRLTIFIPVLFTVITLKSQEVKPALKLYYAINEFELNANAKRLDSLINSFKAKTVNLKLVGYADYLSNPAYNLNLSQKRADAVKNYLSLKYPAVVNVLSSRAIGDKFSKSKNNTDGEPGQRRVDVIIERVVPLNEVDTKPVFIEPPADFKETVEVTTPETPKKEVKETKFEKGKSITLEGLSFEPGRHYILQKSMPVLLKLLKTLKENPELHIEIQGHVCCADGEEDGMDYDTYERKLSVNRAKSVYDYLVKNGIRANHLSYKGFGHTQPKVNPEKNKDDEQMNRRVEILVLED